MTPDDAYIDASNLAPACHLRRAGQWDTALNLLPPDAAPLRAEILVERYMWRLDPPAEAIAAVDQLGESALATLLRSLLEYWRQLFKLDGEPISGDPVDGFADAATDPELAAWATFHHAISTLTLRENPAAADEGFARAFELKPDDAFLESYVVRHQGDLLINWKGDREAGLALLRRSLHLRAALGARPQVAAAASSLAGELPPGPEVDELRAIATMTARELGIPWLQG